VFSAQTIDEGDSEGSLEDIFRTTSDVRVGIDYWVVYHSANVSRDRIMGGHWKEP